MNHCMILPVPALEKFGTLAPVDEGTSRTHLCLNHLLSQNFEMADEYHSYYLERREAGDYIIMDNGADEHSRGASLKHVLAAAMQVKAQEIVLPDVQLNSSMTLELTLHALQWLETYEGRVLYNKAGRPRIQVVPQGQTFASWIDCAEILIEEARRVMDKIDGPSIVVAAAKQYHSLFQAGGRGGRIRQVEWLYQCLHQYEDVHLLGYPRNAYDVGDIERATPGFVRSVDSAKPAVYALNGIKVSSPSRVLEAYPLRPDKFFTITAGEKQETLMEYNIWRFTGGH